MSLISVIIPSYNSASTISATLNGLLSQGGQCIREIIVVDSSDDGGTTRRLIDRYGRRIKKIYLNQKTMPAVARNMGAKAAGGDVLAFIDSDAYPAPDWSEKIAEAYLNGFKAGGGSYLMSGPQKKKLIPAAQFFLQFNEFMAYGNPRKKAFVPSCNLFCDRKLFSKVRGFPQIRASEDILFGLRLSEETLMEFRPEIQVVHIFREGSSDFLQNQKLLGKYVFLYRKKIADPLWSRGFLPFVFILPFLIIKGARIAFRIFKSSAKEFILFSRTMPFFLLGITFWGLGFLKGVFEFDPVFPSE